jgi:hypothetical protein
MVAQAVQLFWKLVRVPPQNDLASKLGLLYQRTAEHWYSQRAEPRRTKPATLIFRSEAAGLMQKPRAGAESVQLQASVTAVGIFDSMLDPVDLLTADQLASQPATDRDSRAGH